MEPITISLIIITITLIIFKLMSKPQAFPPGPPRWPIIGNLIEMRYCGLLPHEAAAKFAKRYGDVTGFYIGKVPIVVISGVKYIKEASSKEELAGRPTSKAILQINGGPYGLVSSEGEFWKEQRRFTLRHLRDLGLGKRSLESIVVEEIIDVLKEIKGMAGPNWEKPVEVQDVIGVAGINILWHVMAGQRYKLSDPRLTALINNVKTILTITNGTGSIGTYFPFILKFFPFLTEIPFILEVREKMRQFLMNDIIKHRETLDPANPRDFLDIYIIEMQKQGANSTFTDDQLIAVCRELFFAGADTTFNSITFGLLYMVLYPDVQTRVQKELDEVVGKDRLPSLDDRLRMPYTEATLQEIMRYSCVAPMTLPHSPLKTMTSYEFKGYTIPRETRVLMNLAGLHMDKDIWGDPENFRPERFLDDKGNVIRHEGLLPFGYGKRQCLGESLARNNLFIFFTTTLQHLRLETPEGEPAPSKDPVGGLTLGPKPYKLKVQPRIDF